MASPLDDKDKLIAAADVAFAEGLKGVDEQLAKEIIKIYAKFVTDGNLLFNAEQLAQIDDAIIAAVAKTDYKLIIDAYIPNYEAVNLLNKELHEVVNDIDIEKVIKENARIANHLSAVESQLRGTPTTLIKALDAQGIEQLVPIRNNSLDELIQPIADVIRRDVITGTSFASATESILDAINKKDLGLQQWAGQIAQDALKQADGIVNQQVKEEFKMKYSRYVGTIKGTTRPVCYHLLTKKEDPVYTDAELGVILAEYIPGGIPSDSVTTKTANRKPQKKGSGMIPGTDTQNFSVRRGGYRCRHDFIPLVKKSNADKIESENLQPEQPKEVVFKPANTIKEVDQRMKDLGVKVFRSKGFSLDQANNTLKSLEIVPKQARPDVVSNFKEYGDIIGRKLSPRENKNYAVVINTSEIKLNKLELTKELREKYKIFESQYTDTATLYTEFRKEGQSFNVMAVNTRKYNTGKKIVDRKILVEKLFTDKGEKYFIKSALEFDNFTHIHEMGHVYDNVKSVIGRKDKLHWALDKWHKDSKIGHLAYNNSDFGTSGYKEAFADAFADYYLTGGENLPKDVLEEMNKLLK